MQYFLKYLSALVLGSSCEYSYARFAKVLDHVQLQQNVPHPAGMLILHFLHITGGEVRHFLQISFPES